MTEEQARISDALESALGIYSRQDKQKIVEGYGEPLATQVFAIVEDALNCPVDWKTASIDTALPVLHDLLMSRYPWLTDGARRAIIHAFVITWK